MSDPTGTHPAAPTRLGAADASSSIPLPPTRILRAVVPSVALVAAAALLFGLASWRALAPATAVSVAPALLIESTALEAADAAARTATVVAQAPGWIEAAPHPVACSALADGVVAEILVLEGDVVERGAPVARLVDDDARIALRRAESVLARRRAERLAAAAEREAAAAAWDNPVERERAVAESAAELARVEAELARQPAVIAAERALLELARAEVELSRAALARGAANEIELVRLEQEAAAQAARLAQVEQGTRILEAQRDRARAQLAAAERHRVLRIDERRVLALAEAGEAAADAALGEAEADRDEAALRLGRMTVTAPIAGAVQRRLRKPGDKVMMGSDDPASAQLVLLYDPAQLQVRADVPLGDAARLRIGQRCEIVADILPDRTFRGVVERIVHEADLQKNTLQAKVRIVDPSPLLRPEMLARVRFLDGDGAAPAGTGATGSRDAIDAAAPIGTARVPAAGVRDGPAVLRVVEREGDRGVVERVAVRVVGAEGAWRTVSGPLRLGDLVVVGADDLADGTRVRIASTWREGGAT